MRLLLVAYEYPPVIAAQAIRWQGLGAALHRLGCEVDVVAPGLLEAEVLESANGDGASRVAWTYPGPFAAFRRLFKRWFGGRRSQPGAAGQAEAGATAPGSGLRERLARVLATPSFEWLPFGFWRAVQLLKRRSYDAVILSYEPSVVLLIGLLLRLWNPSLRIVADLGDPVWHRRATERLGIWRRLEWLTVRSCDAILVTDPRFLRTLESDYPEFKTRFHLVGHGHERVHGIVSQIPTKPVRLLFAGTLYPHARDPATLIQSVSCFDPDLLVLDFVGETNGLVTPSLNVKSHGIVSRSDLRSYVERADVLVNIGNTLPLQSPGKLFEYLELQKPILHLYQRDDDPGLHVIAYTGAGLAARYEPAGVQQALECLLLAAGSGSWASFYSPVTSRINESSWDARASLALAAIRGSDGSKAQTIDS